MPTAQGISIEDGLNEVLMSLSLAEGETTLRGAQLFPLGKWSHPQGEIVVDFPRAQSFAAQFKRGVAGQQLPVFFVHSDPANTANPNWGKAAGWFTDVRADEKRGVVVDIDFTDEGAADVRAGKYKYLSAEFFNRAKLPHRDEPEPDVIMGAAFANRPHLKGMEPILNEETGHLFVVNGSDAEGGGPMDPILLALCKGAGINLSEDATELTEEQREKLTTHLTGQAEEAGKVKDLTSQVQLLTEKIDKDEKGGDGKGGDDEFKTLAEAGFEEEATLLAEYKTEKLIRVMEEPLPAGTQLTPAARELVGKVIADPTDLTSLSEVLNLMTSNKATVDLTEHGSSQEGGEGGKGGSEKEPGVVIIKLAEKIVKENEDIEFGDALLQAAEQEPEAWAEYQNEMGSAKAAVIGGAE